MNELILVDDKDSTLALKSEESQHIRRRINEAVADGIAEHMTRLAVSSLKEGAYEFKHLDRKWRPTLTTGPRSHIEGLSEGKPSFLMRER